MVSFWPSPISIVRVRSSFLISLNYIGCFDCWEFKSDLFKGGLKVACGLKLFPISMFVGIKLLGMASAPTVK